MGQERKKNGYNGQHNLKSKFNLNSLTVFRATLILIIFLSIIPYASLYVWAEAAFAVLIFVLGSIYILKQNHIQKINIHSLFLPIIGLAIYSFIQGSITLLVQIDILPVSSFFPNTFDLTSSFWVAVKILAFACFIKLIQENFRNNIKSLVWSLVASGNIFALIGVFRFLLQNRFPETFNYFLFPQLKPGIGFGTFINQNHFAYLMLMTIGLNICLLWWAKTNKTTKYILISSSLVSITALILTASRGGIISLFGLLAFVIFFSTKATVKNENIGSHKTRISKAFFSLKKLAIFAVVSLILIFGIFFIGQERVITRFERLPLQIEEVPANSSFLRMDVYKATFEMIKENSIFGVGFGGFRYAVSQYIDISGNIVPEQTHNDYLEYIASGGLVAIIFGIWFIINFISKIKVNFGKSNDSFALAAKIGAISGLVGISIHNLFDFSLQTFANLLFVAALIVIAVYHGKPKSVENSSKIFSNSGDRKLYAFKALSLFIFVFLIGYSVTFGISRFKIAKSFDERSFNIIKLPFDAEFHERKFYLNSKAGKNEEAINDLQEAIIYRPADYVLWLKLGQIQQRQNQNETASKSFRRAVELAPYYSEPKFYYGKFLVENEDKREGFKYLNQAFRRNPGYFYSVAEIAWNESEKSGRETVDKLSPLNVYETAMLNIFFFDKKEYSLVVDVTCKNEVLPQAHRDVLVQKLLEKRKYYFAEQIYNRNCRNSDEKIPEFENGDFRSGEIDDGIGFGWRVNNLPDEIKLNIKNKNSINKSPSLEIAFSGNYDPVLPIITQILIVEPNQKYRLNFSYKTNEIVTGGVPVILIIPKKENLDGAFSEIKLSSENSDWIRETIEFETDATTEAIEIRLTRKSCEQDLCPIFGRLQVADFNIQKK